MTVMMILENRSRDLRLLQEALAGSATEIDNSGNASTHADLHHVQDVLNNIEQETILLLKAGRGNANSYTAISNRGTEDWNAGLVC